MWNGSLRVRKICLEVVGILDIIISIIRFSFPGPKPDFPGQDSSSPDHFPFSPSFTSQFAAETKTESVCRNGNLQPTTCINYFLFKQYYHEKKIN